MYSSWDHLHSVKLIFPNPRVLAVVTDIENLVYDGCQVLNRSPEISSWLLRLCLVEHSPVASDTLFRVLHIVLMEELQEMVAIDGLVFQLTRHGPDNFQLLILRTTR